jgi:exopolysaccharide biosynthesis polyprenyl glycosylphosphotransferase
VAIVNDVAVIDEVDPPPPSQQAASRTHVWLRRNKLRLSLIAADVAALTIGWTVALLLLPYNQERGWVLDGLLTVGGVAMGLLVIRANELYLSRIATVRTVEMSRLFRSMVILAFVSYLVFRAARLPFSWREALLASVLSLFLLVIGRSVYRAWLTNARRHGLYLRDVVVVGTKGEGADLVDLMRCHPDLGFRVVGVAGERDEAERNGLGHLWLAPAEEATSLVGPDGATGVVIAAGDLSHSVLNELVRRLQLQRAHIHLSSGVRGIDYRRLRALPLAHEPLFYVEPSGLRRSQLAVKRVIDVVGAVVAIVLFSPLLLALALAVKFSDRGPVFFRQVRVGRNGRLFRCVKFRTMVVDAEAKLAELQRTNERTGPLFKMDRDPRVTKVGKFLRDTSLDELPQLFNVLTGDMSLVGPRPALPDEVARFDEELLGRTRMRPGITGLWQVEARDNPSFSAYRRLDLFYVDNWSVTLDIVIMLATVEQVIARAVTLVFKRESKVEAPAVAEPTDEASAAAA